MVATNTTLGIGDTQALNKFDEVTHVAFGSGTADPTTGDTTMTNELYRAADIISTKDVGNNTYEIVARLPLSQIITVNELGMFDDPSAGTMGGHTISPVTITQTGDEEHLFTLRVKVQTTNI